MWREDILASMPTVDRVGGNGRECWVINIETHNAKEVFEYENGSEFIASPCVRFSAS
jgi:hypothetical protein